MLKLCPDLEPLLRRRTFEPTSTSTLAFKYCKFNDVQHLRQIFYFITAATMPKLCSDIETLPRCQNFDPTFKSNLALQLPTSRTPLRLNVCSGPETTPRPKFCLKLKIQLCPPVFNFKDSIEFSTSNYFIVPSDMSKLCSEVEIMLERKIQPCSAISGTSKCFIKPEIQTAHTHYDERKDRVPVEARKRLAEVLGAE
ncbi:hypothetical protein B0H16DRAFT_1470189 [Mycena metata]|uniref:Uncharacterized protein n=1 Tax=Mycena metata TaxID=1033252 RepID=A0AAD7HVA6_9AGAR|nr:hypothetical protein B0H16DRAFT_1470189 [Mycena metata]